MSTAKKRARPTGSDPIPTGRSGEASADPGRALADAFLTNERINQVLLDLLDERVWRAVPPGSHRRTIASTFAHLHNVRCMYARAARAPGVPGKLDRATLTPAQARAALARSARCVAGVLERAARSGGKLRGLPLDAAGFLALALTHEAHHRGQVCHWARALGAPIQDQHTLWEWHKRQREIARG
jgi:uncharacterized damage-inducible protein DinB